MSPESRYSCQVKLPGFGAKAQKRLRQARVLLVGVGGLGCPTAQYLATAGVGTLTLVDFDTVSLENLHRQILFSDKDVGQLKARVAASHLLRQNPDILVKALPLRLTTENIMRIVESYDVVIDCTDNFETRYLLNDACVLANLPLVYGAAYQYQGQVAVWNAPNADGTRSPHYRDMFPSANTANVLDCSTGGVTPTLTGIIGCMQANETIKYLVGLPGLLAGKLLVFDAQTMQSYIIDLPSVSKTDVTHLPSEDQDIVQTISASKLKAALSDDKFELIDVRTSQERADFSIGGQHVPLGEVLAGRLARQTSKPIVFYCALGKRSAVAARYIQVNNPATTVFSLDGGVQAWLQETESA